MKMAKAFIQWKGTDVCCDFTCTCGAGGHIDTLFMYCVRCPECGKLWESPSFIHFREVDEWDGDFIAEPLDYE